MLWMCGIGQAQNAEEKLAKSMFLPLAERMARKYVEEKKIEAEAGGSAKAGKIKTSCVQN